MVQTSVFPTSLIDDEVRRAANLPKKRQRLDRDPRQKPALKADSSKDYATP